MLWLFKVDNGNVNTQNSHIWKTSRTPDQVNSYDCWCGFTTNLILVPFFFEERCLYQAGKVDDAPPHIACEVKTFLFDTFIKDRVISRSSTLVGLKDALQRTVGCIDVDMLHSAVIGTSLA
ncbi:hypothetical protein CDAR_40051 [Caerostris darwini]|uniref:Uncharacterized protein n=1 Tax=Caerostris darwini TaxID=1538125 RepID=A0AAV4RBU8_9ARAC|nr:hypothetical protein CDAR_40051 [Caerostris darwini]